MLFVVLELLMCLTKGPTSLILRVQDSMAGSRLVPLSQSTSKTVPGSFYFRYHSCSILASSSSLATEALDLESYEVKGRGRRVLGQ